MKAANLYERKFGQIRRVCFASCREFGYFADAMKNLLRLSLLLLLFGGKAFAAEVTFKQSAASVAAYDFVEVTMQVKNLTAANPFTDVIVTGEFRREGGQPVKVDGFCDSTDGSLFRIRFMPDRVGRYSYVIQFWANGAPRSFAGNFEATDGKRRGITRVDKAFPWHFIWEGTGEHYFWNGTTTYSLMGWDEATIRQSIDRLHKLKVNRLRVAINSARVKDGMAWFEPVFPTKNFSFLLNPWLAARPDSVDNPGFDITRFNIEYWQKYERLLAYARERDVIISAIFYVDGAKPGVDPFGKTGAGGTDELRYYRYAAARLAAYSNLMWDVTNEYRLFRDDAWAEFTGAKLREFDPYDHLTSIHGHGDFKFYKSAWADFAMYQSWDEWGGNAFMLKNRRLQERAGRAMPQVNEEYGYEDHYPVGWGGNRKAPMRSADNRRRLAWEMYMAGCYQTTGERADTGTGAPPDTGGGWINGRGDDSMVMLKGYAHIVDFFSQTEWWRMTPNNDLVSGSNLCLAEPGKQYVIYLPGGGAPTIQLEAGKYRAQWFNPMTGQFSDAGIAEAPEWKSSPPPINPYAQDWVLWLKRN